MISVANVTFLTRAMIKLQFCINFLIFLQYQRCLPITNGQKILLRNFEKTALRKVNKQMIFGSREKARTEITLFLPMYYFPHATRFGPLRVPLNLSKFIFSSLFPKKYQLERKKREWLLHVAVSS